VQAQAEPGAVAANVRAAAEWATRAAEAGARLVVFPEAYPTGYDLAAVQSSAPTAGDYGWLAPLQQVVDDRDLVVVLNTPLRTGGRLRMTDLLLAARQAPRDVYSKQHLYPLELDLFEPGDGGASVRVDGVEVALAVCYDANFPEHAAAAARDGAIVYVNSGAYFPGGAHRRDLHYASRALDNGIYVVFSGLVGDPHDFIGGTAAYDPLGRVIRQLDHEEGIVVVDIDPTVVDDVRRDQRMWRDRRPDLGERTRYVV
jgi:predicted amidohydrolase